MKTITWYNFLFNS